MIGNTSLHELWKYEQELIAILHDIDHKNIIQENKKKIFSLDGFIEKQDKNRMPHGLNDVSFFGHHAVAPTISQSDPRPPAKFQGGSLSERIKQLESLSGKCQKNTKNILTFDENSVELSQILAMLNGGTEPNKKTCNSVHSYTKELNSEAPNLEPKARDLSQKILELRQELGLHWLCDTITVKEVNIKMGGDGNFINAEGKQEALPSIPLGQNCPHRQCTSILRCVVCPANYSESAERFNNWLDYIKNQQEANKKRE